MFNQEEFDKNHFILQKIDFNCSLEKTEKPMHIAFNVNDVYFMQTGVALTSIL